MSESEDLRRLLEMAYMALESCQPYFDSDCECSMCTKEGSQIAKTLAAIRARKESHEPKG